MDQLLTYCMGTTSLNKHIPGPAVFQDHTCDLFPHCSLNKNKQGRSQMDVIDPLGHCIYQCLTPPPPPPPPPPPNRPPSPTVRGFHIIYILPPRKSGNWLAPNGNSHSAYEPPARRPHVLFRFYKKRGSDERACRPRRISPFQNQPCTL